MQIDSLWPQRRDRRNKVSALAVDDHAAAGGGAEHEESKRQPGSQGGENPDVRRETAKEHEQSRHHDLGSEHHRQGRRSPPARPDLHLAWHHRTPNRSLRTLSIHHPLMINDQFNDMILM